MAHHIYTTEAFVLESSMGREADRRFTLFTRELGMIRASAQGVRLLKSKLRYSLQDFSYVTLSVVRGKEWWKITNALPHDNLYLTYKNEKYVLYAFARIFRLMSRLIPEEEKNETIFNELVGAIEYAQQHQPPTDLIMPFEYIVALRILNHLGYVGNVPQFQALLGGPLDEPMLKNAQANSKELIALINTSIRESHL